jgi:hypothetical protein
MAKAPEERFGSATELATAVQNWQEVERREAQEERDRFFTLSLDMLCIAGFDGYFKRMNPAFERTLGYTVDEMLSRPFVSFVHADDVEATNREMKSLHRGSTQSASRIGIAARPCIDVLTQLAHGRIRHRLFGALKGHPRLTDLPLDVDAHLGKRGVVEQSLNDPQGVIDALEPLEGEGRNLPGLVCDESFGALERRFEPPQSIVDLRTHIPERLVQGRRAAL